jgi:predicted NAD/FAD-binding protein
MADKKLTFWIHVAPDVEAVHWEALSRSHGVLHILGSDVWTEVFSGSARDACRRLRELADEIEAEAKTAARKGGDDA